jgi:hypothetical protein
MRLQRRRPDAAIGPAILLMRKRLVPFLRGPGESFHAGWNFAEGPAFGTEIAGHDDTGEWMGGGLEEPVIRWVDRASRSSDPRDHKSVEWMF